MRISLTSIKGARGFSTTSSEKIVASILFERLPVVIPKIDRVVYAFQEFSGKGDYQMDYVPAPRISEADKTNDRKSLQRALDRRLYLLIYGNSYGAPSGKPVWHFPEKVYDSEETLRKCAESALTYVLGDLSHTYFVGNAPMGQHGSEVNATWDVQESLAWWIRLGDNSHPKNTSSSSSFSRNFEFLIQKTTCHSRVHCRYLLRSSSPPPPAHLRLYLRRLLNHNKKNPLYFGDSAGEKHSQRGVCETLLAFGLEDLRATISSGEPPTYIQEMMKMMKAMEERAKASDEMANERFTVMEERIVQLSKTVNGGTGKALESPATADGEDMSGTHNGRFIDLVNQTPTKNTVTSAIESSYVTKEQLQRVLEQKNKTLSFSEFDLKLPYAASIAAKHYPKDYTSPKFKLFDGKTGDAREHVMKFVETLGVAGLDDDLKLKEFSKSLTGKAYTWFVNLKSGEDVMDYIQRFRERVLDVHDAHNEKELVKVCIHGMFDEYRIHLENLPLDTFATLVEAARRTNSTIQRQKESYNKRNVHVVQFRERDERSGGNRPPKRSKKDFQGEDDAPPFPVSVERVRALLREWIRDGQINLPYATRLPTAQEKADAKYCDYHRTVNHPFAKCRNMRRLIHRGVQKGEIVINDTGVHNNPLPDHGGQANAVIHSLLDEPEDHHSEDTSVAIVMTSTIAASILKTPNLRRFFDLLGFYEEARKEAAEELVQIANKYHAEGGFVESKIKRLGRAYANAIVFTEADMCTPHDNQNKPLYVESTINGVHIKRTFIDDGSGLNLMSLTTLRALGIDRGSLRHPMTINSFDNRGTRTLGCVLVNFKIGNIQEQTRFHVIDADVAYHNGKEIFIPTTKASFEKSEVRYAETSFFDEVAEKEEGVLSLPMGIPLPPLQEYGEGSKNNMKYNRKRTRRGGKRRRCSTSEGYKVPEKGVTSHTKSNKDLV
ncbi:Ribosomal protein L46 [Corchorus capsularis]|uniref:Ribosomal protein L46 n=1 Tax=Corchorus capsularis TaxID=210143 RepID=A0A1R3JI44_COCAP|nr:Ribosomal protein L46 [Corchorus capsularis]